MMLTVPRITLWIQPICETVSGRVIGHEWLTRWEHTESAASLWQWADQHDQIAEVERHILSTLHDWRHEPEAPSGIWFINLHPRGIASRWDPSDDQNSPRFWSHALAPVVWELLEQPGWLSPVVTALAQEASIALDDWGDSVESTTRLVTWPVRWVKLDRVITRQLGQPEFAAWIRWIQHFAFAAPVSWVAEGVETPEEAEAARVARIPFVQGFGIAPPRPYRTIAW